MSDSGDDSGDGDQGERGERSDRDSTRVDDGGTDLPADVDAALTQLLAKAAADARCHEVDAVIAIIDTVETVTQNKVPDKETRERLLHGCRRVRRLAEDEPLVAAEYLQSMERLVDAT